MAFFPLAKTATSQGRLGLGRQARAAASYLRRSRLRLEELESRVLPSAAPIHVSLTGDDATGDGSPANPFRTLSRAILEADSANDGVDEIRMQAGIYNAAVDVPVTIPNSANIKDLHISGGWDPTFTTQSGTTTFTPSGGPAAITIHDPNVTIHTLEIANSPGIGIFADTGALTFVNTTVLNSALDGLRVEPAALDAATTVFQGVASRNNGGLGIFVDNVENVHLFGPDLRTNAGGVGAQITDAVHLIFTTNISSATNDTVEVTNTYVRWLSGGPPVQQNVNYTTGTLVVRTGDGDDTFTVLSTAPGTTTQLEGGQGNDQFQVNLSTLAGPLTILGEADNDTLAANAAGNNVEWSAGQIGIVVGAQPVTYTGLEAINLTGLVNLIVQGDAGDNTLDVVAAAPADALLTLDSEPPLQVTGVQGLAFEAGVGNDLLRITNPAASVFAPANGIAYDGGGQPGDSLTLQGGGGAGFSVTYTVGPAAGNGTIVTTNGVLTQTITFTGLAPILDTVPAAVLLVTATDAANTIVVDDGTLAGDDIFRVSVDAFEPIEFQNKTTLQINAGVTPADLGDTVTLNFTGPAGALTTVTVNGFAGNDTLTRTQTPAGVTVNLNGDADDDTLVVNTPLGGTVNADGGPGNDTLMVNGTAAADTWTLTAATIAGLGAAFNYTAVENLTLQTLGGNDAVLVTATAPINVLIDTGVDDDRVDIRAVAPGTTLTVALDLGDDEVNIASDAPANAGTLNAILGAVTVTGGAGLDKLVASDAGELANSTGQLTATQISGLGLGSPINYSGLEDLEVRLGSGDDTFTVLSTAPGTLSRVLGNLGRDTFDVQATTGPLILTGGDGNDTFTIGSPGNSLDGILGAVTVQGSLHEGLMTTRTSCTGVVLPFLVGDTLIVNDQGDSDANNYTLTSTTLNRSGAATVTYTDIETLLVNAGSGVNSFDIQNTHANFTQLQGDGGNDDFFIQATSGPTWLFGDSGNDRFIFSNGATLSGGFIDGGPNAPPDFVNGTLPPSGFGGIPIPIVGPLFLTHGGDVLSYANYTTGVTVNLATKTATGTAGVCDIETVIGGSGNDSLTGDSGPNRLEGRDGNDTLDGADGNDLLLGGTGDDNLFGAFGNDVLLGGAGRDFLEGGAGADLLRGGTDPDKMFGDSAADPSMGLAFDSIFIESCSSIQAREDDINVGGLGADGGQIFVADGARFDRPDSKFLPIFAAELDLPTNPPSGPGSSGGTLGASFFTADLGYFRDAEDLLLAGRTRRDPDPFDDIEDAIFVNVDAAAGQSAVVIYDVWSGREKARWSFDAGWAGWLDRSDRILVGDVDDSGADELILVNAPATAGEPLVGGFVRIVDLSNGFVRRVFQYSDTSAGVTYAQLFGGLVDPEDRLFVGHFTQRKHLELLFFNRSEVTPDRIALRVLDLVTGQVTFTSYHDGTIFAGWIDNTDEALVADMNKDHYDDLVVVNRVANPADYRHTPIGFIGMVSIAPLAGTPAGPYRGFYRFFDWNYPAPGENSVFPGYDDSTDQVAAGRVRIGRDEQPVLLLINSSSREQAAYAVLQPRPLQPGVRDSFRLVTTVFHSPANAGFFDPDDRIFMADVNGDESDEIWTYHRTGTAKLRVYETWRADLWREVSHQAGSGGTMAYSATRTTCPTCTGAQPAGNSTPLFVAPSFFTSRTTLYATQPTAPPTPAAHSIVQETTAPPVGDLLADLPAPIRRHALDILFASEELSAPDLDLTLYDLTI